MQPETIYQRPSLMADLSPVLADIQARGLAAMKSVQDVLIAADRARDVLNDFYEAMDSTDVARSDLLPALQNGLEEEARFLALSISGDTSGSGLIDRHGIVTSMNEFQDALNLALESTLEHSRRRLVELREVVADVS